jgi:hypothetical protein
MQQKFTNPLDNVRVAKPCPADWNAMFGNDRKRFCGECKLNVYNLSDMSRGEAENFLLEAEGRVCIRFYRREDGTILTKDCPVGLAALKRRVSRAMTAVFSVFTGLIGGLLGFHLFKDSTIYPVAIAGEMTVDAPPHRPVKIEPRAIQGAIPVRIDPTGSEIRGRYTTDEKAPPQRRKK